MKLIEITWIDSGAQEGRVWDFKDDYAWPRDEFKTIGYRIGKKDGYLYVAQSRNEYQYGRVFRIPIVCIVKIRKLKHA